MAQVAEALKMDVISDSYSVSGSSTAVNFAHGKGTNIRGASLIYFDTNNVKMITAGITSTNIAMTVAVDGGGSANGTMYTTVYYV